MALLANRVNNLLKQAKLTSKDLAVGINISVTAVNMLRRAEGNPTVDVLSKLSDFFAKPISYFVTPEADLDSLDEDDLISLKIYSLEEPIMDYNEMYSVAIGRDRFKNPIFAVRVNSDALSPMFSKGTSFVISNNPPKDGDMVLARLSEKNKIIRMHVVNGKNIFLRLISIHLLSQKKISQF